MLTEREIAPSTLRRSEPFAASFAADLDRQFIYYDGSGPMKKLAVFLTMQSLWSLLVYRLGRAIKTGSMGFAGWLLWPFYRLLEFEVRAATGIVLDVDARIGPGFYIGHFGSTFVGPGVVIGRNCSLGQTCVLSGDGSWPETSAPIIGDRVYLAVGVKIIGPYRVGDDAAVGANAVIFDDVPEKATMVGNPARCVNTNGSAKYLRLREPSATDV